MKISIITINYNNAVGLEKTFTSVFSQTFNELEYVVIDGGSSDGSVEIIKQYEDQISYWVSEKDNGVYNAMNKGILKASGEYLLFLNSGDYLYNELVLQEVNKYLFSNYDIVYGNVNVIQENKAEKLIIYPDNLRFSQLYYGAICHQVIFYKKTVFQKVGFYLEHYSISADWSHFISAISKHHCSYLHIPVTVSSYLLDGISEKPENLKTLIEERENYMRKEYSLFIEDYEELVKLRRESALLRNSKIYKLNQKLKKLLNR